MIEEIGLAGTRGSLDVDEAAGGADESSKNSGTGAFTADERPLTRRPGRLHRVNVVS